MKRENIIKLNHHINNVKEKYLKYSIRFKIQYIKYIKEQCKDYREGIITKETLDYRLSMVRRYSSLSEKTIKYYRRS